MPREEILLETAEVRVRVMELDPGAATPWHFHHQVTDQMVALKGKLRVDLRAPAESRVLPPGERCRVETGRVHRVVNADPHAPASYLLIQGVGRYDFNPVTDPD